MNENNRGLALLIVIIAILIVAVFVGGLLYFVGSQKASRNSPKQENSLTTNATPEVLDDKELERQLDESELEAIEEDLKVLDNEVSTL